MPDIVENLVSDLPDNIKRFLGNGVTKDVKLKVAKGLIPLPVNEQIILLSALYNEQEHEVKEIALQSIKSLPEVSLKNVLKTEIPSWTLNVLSIVFEKNPEYLELIAMNKGTSSGTLLRLIKIGITSVLEVISLNQTRLLNEPDILNALLESPALGKAAQDRLQEFFLRFLSKKYLAEEKKPAVKPSVPATVSDRVKKEEVIQKVKTQEVTPQVISQKQSGPLNEETAENGEVTDAPRQLYNMEIPTAVPESFFELPKELTLDSEEEKKDDRKNETLLQTLTHMNVADKIKLALFGNREVRSNLIRDPNKIVSTSVLKSPKVNDSEVAMYAQSRNICDEIIRMIAGNKEWVKNYRVKHALVNNPKTPLPIAMKLITFLNQRDLKDLANSKNVSGAISGLAKSFLQQRLK